eukprot:1158975-Pelagomonas_calceolata.AAC.35
MHARTHRATRPSRALGDRKDSDVLLVYVFQVPAWKSVRARHAKMSKDVQLSSSRAKTCRFQLSVTTQPLCARVQHGERSKTFPLGTPLMSSAQACRQSLVAGGQPRAKQWVHCTHESRTPQPASPTPCPLICKGSNLSDEFPSHFGAPFDSGGHTLYDRVLKSRGSTGPAMDRPC